MVPLIRGIRGSCFYVDHQVVLTHTCLHLWNLLLQLRVDSKDESCRENTISADTNRISKLTKKFSAYVTFPGFFTFYAKFGKSESRLPWVCYIFGSNSASNSDHKVNIVRLNFDFPEGRT